MKNKYTVKEKLTLILLATGVCCFGLILPDSLSTHTRLVHFAAHFGMSFLIALSFYLFCTVKMRSSKVFSYTVLIFATLLIGMIYKYWEIAAQGVFAKASFSAAIEMSGAITSMSQNLSGLMAAMFLIESLVEKNLVTSVIRAGRLQVGPSGLEKIYSENGQKTSKIRSRFSSVPSDN